jgi:hypothetical protein
VIIKQIFYARNASIISQKKDKCEIKSLIRTSQRNALQQWLQSSSSRTRLSWRDISTIVSELSLQEVRKKVMKTMFQTLNYVWRIFKKKDFSNDSRHMQARVEFARWRIILAKERLYDQIFSDEMWIMREAHKSSYVTVQADKTDRYVIHNVQHKYRKASIWMFHDMLIMTLFYDYKLTNQIKIIFRDKKKSMIFWNKNWDKINSVKYDLYILSQIQTLCETYLEIIYMQNNVSAHRFKLTTRNLQLRNIFIIKWSTYFSDLNLIEHVWNFMKDWMQDRYWKLRYDVTNLSLDQLQHMIWKAWLTMFDSYIKTLLDSWWDRCQTVIDAEGDFIKYWLISWSHWSDWPGSRFSAKKTCSRVCIFPGPPPCKKPLFLRLFRGGDSRLRLIVGSLRWKPTKKLKSEGFLVGSHLSESTINLLYFVSSLNFTSDFYPFVRWIGSTPK